jgi:hypothetical protein
LIVIAKSKGKRGVLRDDHLVKNPATTPTKMIIDAFCPQIGQGWIHMVPIDEDM